MKEDDIVEDIFSRVKKILGHDFTGEIAVKLEDAEHKIRQDWSGVRPYISAKKNFQKKKQEAIEKLSKGVPIPKVVNETGISRTQVYMLLKRSK